MLSINLIERIIIESIYRKEKDFDDIYNDTNLPKTVIENCLMSLLSKNIIIKKLDRYYLNNNLSEEAIQAISSKTNKLNAKKLIMNEIIESSKGDDLGFYKVSMSEKEEKILKGLFYNVEEFLKGLETNKEAKTTDERIIFWGENTYGKVINNIYR